MDWAESCSRQKEKACQNSQVFKARLKAPNEEGGQANHHRMKDDFGER